MGGSSRDEDAEDKPAEADGSLFEVRVCQEIRGVETTSVPV